MRIGLVCPYNIMRGGGVQECVFALQDELAKRGHHAVILTPQSREARNYSGHGVIFLGGGTDVKSPFHTTAQLSASANPNALQAILREEELDVLHFHEPWVPILSRQLLMRSHSANVATFHAKLPANIMSQTIERVVTPYTRSILKYFHSLTAVSEAAATYAQSLTNKPIDIVPNGINLSKYKPVKKAQSPIKTILFIGRLERRKGLKYLLDAYDLLRQNDKNLRLIVAGDGPDRHKLEMYVQENRIKDVQFLGFVDESQKLELLAQADLFCSPALYGESFGIVLLEAMASGVVTVAGNNPGYMSVMQERGALSIVDPKKTVEFANRLNLLLHDQELRRLWKKWAKEYIKQYDYSLIVDKYESLYKKALKENEAKK